MDQNQSSLKDRLAVACYRAFLIAFIIALLYLGREILIPLIYALLFSFLLLPLSNFLERRSLPRPLAIIISLTVFIIIVGFILFFLGFEVVQISKNLPSIFGKLEATLDNARLFVESNFKGLGQQVDLQGMMIERGEAVILDFINKLTTMGDTLLYIGIQPILIYFILYFRKLPTVFIERRYQKHGQESMKDLMYKAQHVIRQYLQGLLWLTVLTFAMDYLILLILGIQYALFFALFLAIMSLIPYIGQIIANVVIVGFALLTKDSLLIPGLVLGLIYLANLAQENIFRPWLVGNSTKINAFAVLLSVIVGGMLWGISGMVLFIPLIGVVKIILEESDTLYPYATFLGGLEESKEKAKEENGVSLEE
ncbi:AI-2E family transporter [Roseivirga sp. BDSF3-8]|uniref:AI-2E family transporter n=1 Tax=Roseivirga sp. BDSF3-8 TaxID=3241598 RepID=UPI0035321698